MWKSKDIYYISDSTGIMISNLGASLICQFPEISFHEEKFPYVRTVKDAKKTLAYILDPDNRPVYIDKAVRELAPALEKIAVEKA